jgi:hypothetical protein
MRNVRQCLALPGMFFGILRSGPPESEYPPEFSCYNCTRPQEPNSPAAEAPEAEFSCWAWHFKTFQTLSIPTYSTPYNWTVNTFTVR